jgi:hypothetical protein
MGLHYSHPDITSRRGSCFAKSFVVRHNPRFHQFARRKFPLHHREVSGQTCLRAKCLPLRDDSRFQWFVRRILKNRKSIRSPSACASRRLFYDREVLAHEGMIPVFKSLLVEILKTGRALLPTDPCGGSPTPLVRRSREPKTTRSAPTKAISSRAALSSYL